MFGDVPTERKCSWNSDNSKHGDETGLYFHVFLVVKILNYFPKKHLVCCDGKSNYLIPIMDYVKAFVLHFVF